MLHSMEHLRNYKIRTAGEDGRRLSIVDVLFDDHDFVVRYFVVDTGEWLPGKKVLIAPEAVASGDWENDLLLTNLRDAQIEECPPLAADAPISQEYRRELALHYGWSAYTAYHPVIGGYGLTGIYGTPPMVTEGERRLATTPPHLAEDGGATSALRSISEVIGYDIHATDGGVGHLEDMILDTSSWAVRYFVADTVNWLPFTKKVLVPSALLRGVSFADRSVSVDLTKEQVKDSPAFDPALPINTERELELFDCYGRKA